MACARHRAGTAGTSILLTRLALTKRGKAFIATVLFVKDLDRATVFYRDVLKLPYQGSDANSSTFHVKDQYLILLSASGAADLLATEEADMHFGGPARGLVAITVADVDALYADLTARGVTFVRPPADQRWGLRTAHFADPEGNLWEINQFLSSEEVPAPAPSTEQGASR